MYSPASLRKFFGSATIQNGWLDTSNLYANFYMYIAIQFLFSLYALLFIYFLNYFDCGILEGLDTLYIYIFFNLLNFYFGQNFITESIWNRTHLPYEIRRFMCVWANFALGSNSVKGKARPNILYEEIRTSEDDQPRNG